MKISATSRCGPGARYVGEDRVDELGAGHVAAERGRGSPRARCPRPDLACERGVDGRRDDLGDLADAEHAVGALDHRRSGVSSAAANSASTNGASSAALSSMNPRSPPCSLDASVETLLATSSNDVPALRSASALAALALAAAIAGPSGSVAPSAMLGLDRDHPRVAELRGRRLLGEPGVDVGVGDGHALLRRRAAP